MFPLDLLFVALLVSVGCLPWWVAGRLVIPARERVPFEEMDGLMRLGTLRRGATWWADTLGHGPLGQGR